MCQAFCAEDFFGLERAAKRLAVLGPDLLPVLAVARRPLVPMLAGFLRSSPVQAPCLLLSVPANLALNHTWQARVCPIYVHVVEATRHVQCLFGRVCILSQSQVRPRFNILHARVCRAGCRLLASAKGRRVPLVPGFCLTTASAPSQVDSCTTDVSILQPECFAPLPGQGPMKSQLPWTTGPW